MELENTDADAPSESFDLSAALRESQDEIYSKEEVKEQPEVDSPAPEKPTEDIEAAAKNEEEAKEETVKAIKVETPHTMPKELTEEWGKAPESVREWVGKRERESQQEISRLGNEVGRARPIIDKLEAAQSIFDRNGVDMQEGLEILLSYAKLEQENPQAVIQSLAEKYGYQLGQTQQQPQNRELAQLRQELASIKNTQTMNERRAVEQTSSQAQEQLTKWSEGKEHFEAVRGLMAPFVEQGDDLDAAYDKACHADPTIREQLLAEQQKATAEKQRQEQEAAVKEAKKAKRSQSGTTSAAKATSGDWRDTLRQQADKLHT